MLGLVAARSVRALTSSSSGSTCTALGTAARNGARFAPFIVGVGIRPAGSYAGDAVVALLRTLRYFGVTVHDLNADRGYTRLYYERFGRAALQMVDNIVLDLTENQRRRKADWTVVRGKGTPDERTVHILGMAGGYFSGEYVAGVRPGAEFVTGVTG